MLPLAFVINVMRNLIETLIISMEIPSETCYSFRKDFFRYVLCIKHTVSENKIKTKYLFSGKSIISEER